MLRRLALTVAALLFSTAASAEWREAATPHFVIWSDSSEAELRKFATRLEGVDQVLRLATGQPLDSPAQKVRVFLVGDVGAVQRAYGGKNPNVAGFYTVNEAGPMAVSPRRMGPDSGSFSADLVLAHEYGHHFMLQYLPDTYPSWYVEGFAELASTIAPMGGGKYSYGKAASHHGYSLTESRWLPVERLMTAAYADLSRDDFDFYGQSWLLTHFLTLDNARAAQFRNYLGAIRSGKGHKAASAAFGDLAKLNSDLRRYLAEASFTYKAVAVTPVAPGAIALRALTAGEAALIPETIVMRDSVEDGRAAAAWLANIRAKTARYPGDRHALQLQADAEYAAEEYAAAAATADKALAVAPGDHRALVRKGLAILRQADKLQGPALQAKVKEARAAIFAAHKAAPDAALPKVAFYQAVRRVGPVSGNVLQGLADAVTAVPQDDGFRMMLVEELAERGNYAGAIAYLGPLAFSPHASGEQKAAYKLYEELQKKRTEATKTSAR